MRARLYSVGIREEGRGGGGDSSTLALKIIRCLDSNKNVKNMLKYVIFIATGCANISFYLKHGLNPLIPLAVPQHFVFVTGDLNP